jgi:hypothetical protein
MPALESRRVRTHPRTVTSVNGNTALEYVGYRHNAHNILSVNSRKKKHLSTLMGGYLCYLPSAIRQVDFAAKGKIWK